MYIKDFDLYKCTGKIGCHNIFPIEEMESKLCYCKDCKNKYHRKSYKDSWYLTSRKNYSKNQIKLREYQKELRKINKEKVIKHYSNNTMKCCHCGNSDLRVLSIDHINGNGYEHRKKVHSGSPFYQWIIQNDYPKGFQVLCMNCQFIKRYENGEIRSI